MKELTQDYELTQEEEHIVITSGTITIIDNRETGNVIITVNEGAHLIYKGTGNTKKKFFIHKNAHVKCYDIGTEVTILAELLEEQANFSQKGLLIGNGTWNIQAHHKAPETTSDLVIRTVLTKKERAQINGLIRIEKSCQEAQGNQKIDSLLLDSSAIVQALPQLEIETDQVSCSHAATISKLDEESLFYLESRGIQKEEAKQLLINGFMNFDETIIEIRGEN